MREGLGDPSGTRLVAVSQQQRDDWLTLAELMDEEGFNPEMTARLMQTLKAWDAAPAAYGDLRDDPRGKILRAVSKAFREDYGTPAFTVDAVTDAVLAALGVPANPANEDHHA